jgi:hypothetical protein
MIVAITKINKINGTTTTKMINKTYNFTDGQQQQRQEKKQLIK